MSQQQQQKGEFLKYIGFCQKWIWTPLGRWETLQQYLFEDMTGCSVLDNLGIWNVVTEHWMVRISLLMKSSPSCLSVKTAIPQSIAQPGAVRSTLERKLKPSAAGQSFHADSEDRKPSLSSWRQWKTGWDASCISWGWSQMPGKSSFPQILVSGYSQKGFSSFSRPGEWDFQYPNQEAEVAIFISLLWLCP